MADRPGFNLKLEQYLLGELTPDENTRLEAQLARDAGLRQQLEQLRGDSAAYFAKYPRLTQPAKKSWLAEPISRYAAGGLALATAAILVIVLMPRHTGTEPANGTAKTSDGGQTLIAAHNPDTGDRSKGLKAALLLSVMRNQKAQALGDGDTVAAGDEILIAYRSSGYKYGVIVSVDAQKSVTLHYPAKVTGSQQLAVGKGQLATAFKLDETLGFEKFYFVTSDNELPLQQILSVLEKKGKMTGLKTGTAHVSAVMLKKQ